MPAGLVARWARALVRTREARLLAYKVVDHQNQGGLDPADAAAYRMAVTSARPGGRRGPHGPGRARQASTAGRTSRSSSARSRITGAMPRRRQSRQGRSRCRSSCWRRDWWRSDQSDVGRGSELRREPAIDPRRESAGSSGLAAILADPASRADGDRCDARAAGALGPGRHELAGRARGGCRGVPCGRDGGPSLPDRRTARRRTWGPVGHGGSRAGHASGRARRPRRVLGRRSISSGGPSAVDAVAGETRSAAGWRRSWAPSTSVQTIDPDDPALAARVVTLQSWWLLGVLQRAIDDTRVYLNGT